MLTLIAGIVMLGILVFVHELGHFCVAKMAGVKILKFSLGFGPRLISRTWGETEYMICAIPLGGYVQMLGEGGGDDGEQAQLTPEEEERSFAAKPVSRRTAIIAAGPIMNLLLPFVVLPLAYLVGVNLPAYLDRAPCVGFVVADSEGGRSGFEAGDCLVGLNGAPLMSWSDANKALLSQAGAPLEFDVDRGGQRLALAMTPENGGIEGLQSLGLLPPQDAVVGALMPGMPAQGAGIEPGDRIVAIDGHPIGSWYELKENIQRSEGSPQSFQLDRNGETLTLSVKPVLDEANGEAYLVGIAPLQETEFKRFGLMAAVQAGAERTVDLIQLTVVFIQKLFTGHVSSKNIGGPITVVQIAGQAAQTDLSAIFSVLAFLSIQLGILNLLPIPILDGGHLFFNLFEMLLRRPVSLRVREIAQQIGLAMLIMLMVLAFYNDIMRLFLGGQ